MKKGEYYGRRIDDYANSNREYPEKIFHDIIEYSHITENSNLLEIGAATGTATDGFLDYPIDVLEITEAQVDYLGKKYKSYKNINVLLSKFEDYDTEKKYDLIYAATSFHWIDSKIGYPKVARNLKIGGVIALFWNLTYGCHGDGEYGKLQDIEAKYGLSLKDPSEDFFDKMKLAVTFNLYAVQKFENIVARKYEYDRIYNAENYLAWIRSRWFAFEEISGKAQEEFENEVKEFFINVGGEVTIKQTVLLVLATRK